MWADVGKHYAGSKILLLSVILYVISLSPSLTYNFVILETIKAWHLRFLMANMSEMRD